MGQMVLCSLYPIFPVMASSDRETDNGVKVYHHHKDLPMLSLRSHTHLLSAPSLTPDSCSSVQRGHWPLEVTDNRET